MWRADPNFRGRTLVLKRWTWFAVNPPVPFAILFLFAGGYFGASRDFGAFLISIPILTLLFLVAFVAAVRAGINKVERPRVLIAWILMGLAPLAYLCSYQPVQQIRFLLWAPAHYSQLAEASKKNGIVTGWDGWGMAGQDTSSYLVVDTEDRLGAMARANKWTKEIGQSCGLWEVQRVWPRLYIVTTYTNCPYDGVEPAN